MKILICSDIHGDLTGAENVIKAFESDRFDKLLILGDILYHGPRNNLPEGYNPKAVISLLNSYKSKILAVRGNCDTEVDQMVLEFPILADYIYLYAGGKTILATHGHKFNIQTPPPLQKGEILLHGHTHIPLIEAFGNDNLCINPGSASIPKGGYAPSYAILSDNSLEIRDFNNRIINRIDF